MRNAMRIVSLFFFFAMPESAMPERACWPMSGATMRRSSPAPPAEPQELGRTPRIAPNPKNQIERLRKTSRPFAAWVA